MSDDYEYKENRFEGRRKGASRGSGGDWRRQNGNYRGRSEHRPSDVYRDESGADMSDAYRDEPGTDASSMYRNEPGADASSAYTGEPGINASGAYDGDGIYPQEGGDEARRKSNQKWPITTSNIRWTSSRSATPWR